MKFDVLTLFPEMFEPLKQSIIGRAIENNLIEIVNHPKQIVKIRINKKLEKNDIIKVKH